MERTPRRHEKSSNIDESGKGNSLFNVSPFASPVAQVKLHAAGNLTGELRKVKDIAADFHNLAMKWNTLHSQGMDIVTQIANIKIEKVFNKQEMEIDISKLPTLPPELNPLCDRLCGLVDSMETIEVKLKSKVEVIDGLISLQQFHKSKAEHECYSILFTTMTLQDVADTVRSIHQRYRKELMFKKELCKIIAHADSRDAMMFYSVSWMHQPYIDDQSQDLIKALLKETGHVK